MVKRRTGSDWKVLVSLGLILLALATVIDRVLGLVYAHYTGNKWVILLAGFAFALGLGALLISLMTSREPSR